MNSTEEFLRCSNPDCQKEKTGVCIEGHEPLISCPFLNSTGSSAEDDDDADDEKELGVEIIQETVKTMFYDGDALITENVDAFLRKKDVSIISIVGDSDSGKTTLVCSIYEKFLKGEFANLAFKGSQTLYGFEKRAHYSRIDSGNTTPDTQRTSMLDGLKFFHLSLVSKEEKNREINFMISDRAGENYEEARSNPEAALRLFEIKKSHVVALLVDGKKISNPMQRVSVTQSVKQMLRILVENQLVGLDSVVQILITKTDLICNENKENNNIFIDTFFNKIHLEFNDKLGSIELFKVAARALDNSAIDDDGLSLLLRSWCFLKKPSSRKVDYKFRPETQFDHIHLRTIMREE